MVVNIAYAPQVDCIENGKETFREHNGSRAECDTGWLERDCMRRPKLTH